MPGNICGWMKTRELSKYKYFIFLLFEVRKIKIEAD